MAQLRWYATMVLLLAVLIGASACQAKVRERLDSVDEVTVKIYEHGEVIDQTRLSTDSPAITEIKRWAESNQRGWWPDVRTYAPGVLLSAPEFSLNILPGRVVFVVAQDEYFKSISDDEYQQLTQRIRK